MTSRMQPSGAHRGALVRLGSRRARASLAVLLVYCCVAQTVAHAEEFAPSLYVRTDSDHTTVVSPRVRLRAPLDAATNLDFSYAVDVWTSASVDIVASASEAVTEQRDELNVGADHAFEDWIASAGYRYSHEPDFVSHGGHVGGSFDFADKSTTLGARLTFSADDVGRAGDPGFSRSAQTLGIQTSLTQVLDENTLIQALYDLGRGTGYQASPYRFVAIGGDGLCHGPGISLCVPERAPDERVRHAFAVRLRRALGERWSAGAGYRFYLDSWGVTSHTVSASVTWSPSATASVALQYRGYTQSAADHYRSIYPTQDVLGSFFTGDKELSPLSSQRLLVDLEDSTWLDATLLLRFGISVGPTLYAYRDYRFLDSMVALDATSWAMLEF
jgi:hypothetical protein